MDRRVYLSFSIKRIIRHNRNGHIIEQKPHCLAHSNIESLALLDQENKGANWLKWRTRWVPIRTISLISAKIKITFDQPMPLYQRLAPKIKELKALGMSNLEIEAKLNISKTTVRKGLE